MKPVVGNIVDFVDKATGPCEC